MSKTRLNNDLRREILFRFLFNHLKWPTIYAEFHNTLNGMGNAILKEIWGVPLSYFRKFKSEDRYFSEQDSFCLTLKLPKDKGGPRAVFHIRNNRTIRPMEIDVVLDSKFGPFAKPFANLPRFICHGSNLVYMPSTTVNENFQYPIPKFLDGVAWVPNEDHADTMNPQKLNKGIRMILEASKREKKSTLKTVYEMVSTYKTQELEVERAVKELHALLTNSSSISVFLDKMPELEDCIPKIPSRALTITSHGLRSSLQSLAKHGVPPQ